MGVIRRSNSPYSSPIEIVQKKDGTLRICPDYRKLNKISIFDPEPMNTAEDIMANMNQAKYYTKLNLCKGYWQIPMYEANIEKTAFITQDGHYEFTRKAFGFVISGATLAKGLREVLKNHGNVVIYVDDIIVYNNTLKENLKTIEKVLQKQKEVSITLKPSKYMSVKQK